MRLPLISLLSLGTFLGGCDSHSELDDLPDRSLLVLDDNWSGSEDGEFQVMIGFSGQLCAQFDASLQATANGAPLALSEPGGVDTSDTRGHCRYPTLRGQLAALTGGPTVVRVWDGSLAIEAEFLHLFGERRLEVVEPGGELHTGDTVKLRWSPATDELVSSTGAPLATTTVSGGGATGNRFSVPASIANHEIVFTIPEPGPLARAGSGRLDLVDVRVHARASRCEGAVSCTGRVDPRRNPAATATFNENPRP